METTVKKREWVKDAAIIFLAVLLVLTFFSNTIMNRSLPEVATAPVTNGNIVAKVRGSGTVAANGKHQVKAKETRTIRSVMVKAGQEVNAGDVLFVLGEGDETELEQAKEKLRSLRTSYQRTALSTPVADYSSYYRAIENAEIAYQRALDRLEEAQVKADEQSMAESTDGNQMKSDTATKNASDDLAKATEVRVQADREKHALSLSSVDVLGPLAKGVDSELAHRMCRFDPGLYYFGLQCKGLIAQHVCFLPAVASAEVFERTAEHQGAYPEIVYLSRHFFIQHRHQAGSGSSGYYLKRPSDRALDRLCPIGEHLHLFLCRNDGAYTTEVGADPC